MCQSIFIDEFRQKEENEGVTILDVRERDEFADGHIPSAINLPLSELENRLNELNKDLLYYVICHSGRRSENACAFLSHRGFNVVNVIGGMSSWKGDIV